MNNNENDNEDLHVVVVVRPLTFNFHLTLHSLYEVASIRLSEIIELHSSLITRKRLHFCHC